jgi:WD40 repeat protein
VRVWNVSTGRTLLSYSGHLSGVTAVGWSPDGKHIASVGFDMSVQVWNAFTGKPTGMYCCHGWLNGVAWSPDGKYVAMANSNKTVQILDAMTGNPVLTYRGHRGEVLAVAWSPDGTRIASGSGDNTIGVWQAMLP